MRRSRSLLAVSVAAALFVVACGGDAALPSEVTSPEISVDSAPTPTFPTCDDPGEYASQSYARIDPLPAPSVVVAGDPSTSAVERIREQGRIVAGVSGDTLLFGARNPLTDQIEGFDIDMVTEVAHAIFGEDLTGRIEYRVITYADRLPQLEAGTVDIVAHTMTINCNRWKRIAFSSEYFAAGQKLLVKSGSGIDSIFTLDDKAGTVCAPEGSTNIDFVNDTGLFPNLIVIGKPDISDCLVAMQQGEADATTGDDTVLAGFAAQDPNTEVVGEAFTAEPYGLGFNQADTDLVQLANAVIAEMKTDGRWADQYQRWLLDTGALPLDAPPAPPTGDETRPLP